MLVSLCRARVHNRENRSGGRAGDAPPKAVAPQRAVDVAVVLAGRAPQSLAAIKDFFAAGRLDVDDALAAKQRIQRELYFSQDFAEGKAAFYRRREPRFTGN